MKSLITVLTVLFSSVLFAQDIDLTQSQIDLVSTLHHRSDEKGAVAKEVPGHLADSSKLKPMFISINTNEKSIKIFDEDSDTLTYDLTYKFVHQGEGSGSISLKPDETMFMVRDENVFMVTHSKNTKTMHVIMNDNKIDLYGYLFTKDEYQESLKKTEE